jgi:hypothetical protein
MEFFTQAGNFCNQKRAVIIRREWPTSAMLFMDIGYGTNERNLSREKTIVQYFIEIGRQEIDRKGKITGEPGKFALFHISVGFAF